MDFVNELRRCVTASRGIDCRDPDLLLGAADEIERLREVERRYKVMLAANRSAASSG